MEQEYHTLRVKKHESCSSRFRFLFFSGSATMAPTEVKDMLGARIAALRRQAGMNQGELAKKLGISPSTVGMYEQGRRDS